MKSIACSSCLASVAYAKATSDRTRTAASTRRPALVRCRQKGLLHRSRRNADRTHFQGEGLQRRAKNFEALSPSHTRTHTRTLCKNFEAHTLSLTYSLTRTLSLSQTHTLWEREREREMKNGFVFIPPPKTEPLFQCVQLQKKICALLEKKRRKKWNRQTDRSKKEE